MTTMMINYPIISTQVYVNKANRSMASGYAVKDWIVVGWLENARDCIYLYNCYGHRVSKLRFHVWEDAVKTAEFIDKHYQDYFQLWEDDRRANVILLARYTIPDGEVLYNIFEEQFAEKVVTFDEVERAYEQSRLNT